MNTFCRSSISTRNFLSLYIFFILAAPTAEQIETERERNERNGQEEVCMDDPTPDPEDPLNFRCVEECSNFGNHFEVNKEKKTCFGESNPTCKIHIAL